MSRQQNVSEETAQKIDAEIRRLVEAGLAEARRILADHRDELETLAQGLLEYETLSGDEIRACSPASRRSARRGDERPSPKASAVPVTKGKPKAGRRARRRAGAAAAGLGRDHE